MNISIRLSAALDILLVVVVGIGTKIVFSNIEAVGWRFSSFPAFTVVLVMTTWMLNARGWHWRDVGLVFPTTIKGWAICIAQALLAIIVIVSVTIAFGMWVGQFFAVTPETEGRFDGIVGHFPTYLMWVFFSVAIGGFAEEMIFRGFLINRFESLLSNIAPIRKSSLVSLSAIILPALLFGFAHFYYKGMNGALRVTVYGLVSGLFYLAYGRRLLPLIIGHAAWDMLIMTVRYIDPPDDGGFFS